MALTTRGFTRGRRWAGAAEGLGTSIVVVLLVAAVVYAASRPAIRIRTDLTEGAQYTLSEQTERILADLPAPVVVTTIFQPEFQLLDNGLYAVQQKAADYVQNLLQEYAIASGGDLTLQVLDPNTDPVGTRAVIQQYGVTRKNVVVIACEERAKQLFLEDDLVTIDRGFANPEGIQQAELRAYHTEGPLTSAILGVTSEQAPRIGFLVGYGGASIEDMGPFGLGVLTQTLTAQGFDVTTVDLGTEEQDALPEVDVLAIVGPNKPLGSDALQRIGAYHDAGGALLLAFDSWLLDAGADELLARVGLRQERAIIARDDIPVEGPERSLVPVRRFLPDHPITASIAREGFGGSFPAASHLGRLEEAPPELLTHVLAMTDSSVFGDKIEGWSRPGDYVFDEGTEIRWERVIAFAVEGGPGRVVAFGGSGFMGNGFHAARAGSPANMDLLLNAANWLAEREQAMAARPRDAYASRVDLYEEERSLVFLYVVVLMPLGGAALGLLVWFARRR